MRQCDKCKVGVWGARKNCPLCQGALSGEAGEEPEIFPVIPTLYRQFSLFFRILLFVSIAVIAISLAINLMIPGDSLWPMIVIAGVAGMWLALSIAARKRYNISKNILYQVFVLSLVMVVLDLLTGWNRWSVDYGIPAVCTFGILTIAVISIVMYRKIEDYLVYLMINGLFGVVPLVLLLLGVAGVVWPSVTSMLVSVMSLSGLLLFSGVDVRSELKKRLHL